MQNDQETLQLLAQLGLNQDPMAQMGGLVNMLNALQEPERFQQEMALRQQSENRQAEQFGLSQDIQRENMGREDARFDQQAEQWAEQFGLSKLLANEERTYRAQQAKVSQEQAQRSFAAHLLGTLSQAQSNPYSAGFFDTTAFTSQFQEAGFGNNLFNPVGRGAVDDGLQATNPIQANLLSARRELFPQ